MAHGPDLDAVIATALDEDGLGSGGGGDLTSAATVGAQVTVDAAVVARSEGTVAGVTVAARVFTTVDDAVTVHERCEDGDRVRAGDVVLEIEGPARSVLAAERTALNFLTHLSGIATITARYVAAVESTRAVVRDTRKTLPGLRALEKAAVAAGGGMNHRAALDDGLLVKDNHVAAAGSVAEATRRALAAAEGLGVQVEVDDLDGLTEALAAGARSVLLDNFSVDELAEGVRRCRALEEQVFVEASGGVGLDAVAVIAATGVDAVAVGALTHSAPVLDLGLDVEL